MIDIDNINTRKEFRHWFDRNFGKNTTIKFEPIYDIFMMAKRYRKAQMQKEKNTATSQEVADRISRENRSGVAGFIIVTALVVLIAQAITG